MRRTPTQARAQTKHSTVFSFSLPQTSRPLFARAMEFLKRLRRLGKTNAAREFMLRWSKCTRVPPVETVTKSNQVFDALHCSAEIHHATSNDGGNDMKPCERNRLRSPRIGRRHWK